jgi:hypothetical protein
VLEGDGPSARGPLGRLLDRAVRAMDVRLRRAQGVFEFSASGECVFRLAIEPAEESVRLRDGVVIERGEPVIVLHFWNEHLPAMPREGPNFAWANLFRRRINRSLGEIADLFDADPRLREIRAVHARLASPTPGERQTVKRFGENFGLETIASEAPPPLGRRIQDLMDKIWSWILVWTYNPPGLKGRSVMQRREYLWMSKATLQSRFGSKDRGAVGAARNATP